jgi:hypothetical protein
MLRVIYVSSVDKYGKLSRLFPNTGPVFACNNMESTTGLGENFVVSTDRDSVLP